MKDRKNFAKRIGKTIQRYRKEKDLTQEQLAEKLKISQTYLSSIERGASIPSLITFTDIVDELGITPNDILCDVTKAGYIIKASWITDIVSKLPPKEQEKILAVVETMVKNVK